MMKKKGRLVILILAILIFVFPYLWVETSTLIYKETFKDLYLQTYEMITDNHCIDKDNYCKVFYKFGNKAKVFFATDTSTFMCYFTKDSSGDSWQMDSANVLWSKSGSASKITFPFYPVKDLRSYLN